MGWPVLILKLQVTRELSLTFGLTQLVGLHLLDVVFGGEFSFSMSGDL